ncbi:hypothetical protein J6590_035701 [Homalodisca vitripennis]|nr:hypothetical protein J6590_035701 [Homalodisca vitripennis]
MKKLDILFYILEELSVQRYVPLLDLSSGGTYEKTIEHFSDFTWISNHNSIISEQLNKVIVCETLVYECRDRLELNAPCSPCRAICFLVSYIIAYYKK